MTCGSRSRTASTATTWGRFVPGDLLAELVVGSLDDALDAATAGLTPRCASRSARAGQRAWLGTVAMATAPTSRLGDRSGRALRARMVALGALPFAFDLPFTLRPRPASLSCGGPRRPHRPCWRSRPWSAPTAADPDALAAFGPIELLRDELRGRLRRPSRQHAGRGGGASRSTAGRCASTRAGRPVGAPGRGPGPGWWAAPTSTRPGWRCGACWRSAARRARSCGTGPAASSGRSLRPVRARPSGRS